MTTSLSSQLPASDTTSTTGTKRKRSSTTQSHPCLGYSWSGLRCRSVVANPLLNYCKSHREFEGKELTTRQCSGTFGSDGGCSTIVTVVKESGDAEPALCKTHRTQKDCEFVSCYGKDEDGTKCRTFVRMDRAPYYCLQHKRQARHQVDAIKSMTDDVLFMVMSYLEPYERVTFALANKGCASIARSWGSRGDSHSTTKKAAVPYSIPNRYFDMTTLVLICNKDVTRAEVIPRGFAQETLSQNTASERPLSRDLYPILACDKCDSHYSGISINSMFRWFQAPLERLHPVGNSGGWSKIVYTMRCYPWLFLKAERQCMSCKRTDKALNCSSICGSCYKTVQICMRWCTQCNGRPSILDISRAWWASQEKAGNALIDS